MNAPRQYLTVAVAFLGWMCAGVQMGTMPLASLSVSKNLLGDQFKPDIAAAWFGYFTAALSLGAAVGGILLGWAGDHWGRARAMAVSILLYSVFAGACSQATSQEQLLVLRFFAGLGIGGMWPNGVSLVSEVLPDLSRPWMAGLIGTSANVGMLLISQAGRMKSVTPDSWRWLFLASAVPALMGLVALWAVPESPRWLATRNDPQKKPDTPLSELFAPAMRRTTVVGIMLASIPLIAAWSAGRWLTPWADAEAGAAHPEFKATTQATWAGGAAIGSFFGAQVASLLGRRLTYFLISLGSVTLTCGIFLFFKPLDPLFLPMVFVQGLVATLFFGWLPLCLPELFPTRMRATGTGISYNFGRFIVAGGVLATGELTRLFGGDYSKAGAIMGLVYALGMIVIWFAPPTLGKKLED
ncbi:MAG: MFS transporter [Pedosphaera sp.]|nr:MFS transporter [Pedosphaera sp.]